MIASIKRARKMVAESGEDEVTYGRLYTFAQINHLILVKLLCADQAAAD